MPVFDISFDYKSDKPRKTRPDADRDSSRLLLDRKLLRPKKLRSGAPFAPIAPSARRDDYLVLIDASGRVIATAATLNEDQRARYLDPPYTIGSSMIWPGRSKDRPTMDTARGFRSLMSADR